MCSGRNLRYVLLHTRSHTLKHTNTCPSLSLPPLTSFSHNHLEHPYSNPSQQGAQFYNPSRQKTLSHNHSLWHPHRRRKRR